MSCPPPRYPLGGWDHHNRQPTPAHLRGPIVEDQESAWTPLFLGIALGIAVIPLLVWWS